MQARYLAPFLLFLLLPAHAREDTEMPDEAFLEFLAQFNPEEDEVLDFAFDDVENPPEARNGNDQNDQSDEVENETAR